MAAAQHCQAVVIALLKSASEGNPAQVYGVLTAALPEGARCRQTVPCREGGLNRSTLAHWRAVTVVVSKAYRVSAGCCGAVHPAVLAVLHMLHRLVHHLLERRACRRKYVSIGEERPFVSKSSDATIRATLLDPHAQGLPGHLTRPG
eukprot:GHUV01029282.1.p1 GENE.GHUV01029282.1~~GHUV01029282.1.p1  ORF type:complete len:147 (-),score=3.14 GHUV01029282.1:420-860(-)